jgi:bacterioferritin-associated ferredoxin
MIVCSCNVIDTDMIKAAVKKVSEPNERMVLSMMGWEPDCSQCTKFLVSEIRRVMTEINNTSSLTEGEQDVGC